MSVHDRLVVRRTAQALDERELAATTDSGLDTVFRTSPPGHLAPGTYDGTVLLFPGSRLCQALAVVLRLLVWQGKVVNDRGDALVNRVTPLRLRLVKAAVGEGLSWVDDEACVVIDYSRTSLVARWVRDETREVAPGLNLGVVWLRRRRVAWFTLRSTARG